MPTRPPLHHTHTYVELPVSKALFEEVRKKLEEADYHHAFEYERSTVGEKVVNLINMHGIALVPLAEGEEVVHVTKNEVHPPQRPS